MKVQKIILLIILALSFVLRVYKLDQYPAGLNADEAAIGYNAYSLIQTGKDEFGHKWPVNFQSFNDYKPGLYFYIVLPFVKLLGLNEWAVRLPSAILGTITVLLVYLIAIKIFHNQKIGLFSMGIIAFNPWHLHFSRGGWESNASLFFMTMGIYLFFKFFEKNRYLILSSIFFILSMYTYHSARVIAPLLIFGLAIIYFKKVFIKNNTKIIIITTILSIIIALPLLISLKGGAGVSRFSGVGIFSDQGPIWRTNELRGQHSNPFSFIQKIIHNKYLEYFVLFVDNYTRHYAGNFLFISGDEIQRNRVPEIGQMYLLDIVLILGGIYWLIRSPARGKLIIFLWLIIAPIAASLTFQSPHAIRALNMIIPLSLLGGVGVNGIFESIKRNLNQTVKKTFCILLVVCYSWNILFYLHQYYVHYPKTYPFAWEYGFKQLVQALRPIENNYDKIVITNRYDQPYILMAFFLKYPPLDFQKEAILTERDQYGFSTVEKFGKYYFGSKYFDVIDNKSTLYISTSEELPKSAKIKQEIKFMDKEKNAFILFEK